MLCKVDEDRTKTFFITQLGQLFDAAKYATWKAFLGKYLNIIATFIWNYMDLFVMIVSLGISTRFKQINDDLERIKGKVNVYMFQKKNCFQ